MPTVDEMRIVMDADTARMVNGMRSADRYLAQFVQNAEKRLNRLDTFTRRAGAGFATLGAGLGAGQILEYANSWTRVERALESNEEIFGMTLKSASELNAMANEARSDVESFTKTYIRAASAIRDYGYDSDVAARLTSTLAKALKLGSATASEQASVLLQFGQALQKGKLDGDEFRSIMENAGVVQELLAQRLGVTKGEIIKLAAAGKLQIPDLVGAMVDGGEQIDRIFRQMPATVDESMTVLRNAMTEYLGDLDRATGATSSLSGAIGGLARNIEPIADAALSVAAGLTAAFSGPAARGLTSFAVGAATALPPLRAIAFLLAASSAAISLFGDDISASADGLVNLSDTAQAFINVASSELAPVASTVSDAWSIAVQVITDALAGFPVSIEDLLAVARDVTNKTIGLFVAAGRVIVNTFTALPAAVGEQVIAMANNVIETIEGLIREAVGAINKLPGVEIQAPDLSTFENGFEGAGTRLRENMAQIGEDMGRDYVGAVGSAVSSVAAKVEAERRRIAEFRRWAAGTEVSRGGGAKAAPAAGIDEKMAREAKRAAEQIASLQGRALEASGAYRMAVQLEYERDLAAFQDMLERKVISQTQFDQARAALAEIAARDIAEATEREFENLRAATDAVSDAMSSAFDDFVQSGKFSFSSFASSVLADIARIALRMTVLEPLFGGGSSGGSGLIFSALSSAFGGFRANGGPVSPRKAYVVGERGPELMVPATAGRIIPNASLPAGAGDGVSVSLTINAPNSTPDAVRQLEARIPSLVLSGVREALNRRMA